MADTNPRRYEHHPPHRPAHLARRMTPPPDRPAPPNLRYLAYLGLALTAVLAALAVPYLVGYLIQVIGG